MTKKREAKSPKVKTHAQKLENSKRILGTKYLLSGESTFEYVPSGHRSTVLEKFKREMEEARSAKGAGELPPNVVGLKRDGTKG